MITVPLFILLGELLFRSGSIDVLFDSLDKLIGRLRGREHVVVVSSSVLLGALLGRTLVPSALDRGRTRGWSALWHWGARVWRRSSRPAS